MRTSQSCSSGEVRRGRRERGVTMIVGVLALSALIGAGAFVVNSGFVWNARTQLQGAADGAALAGAAQARPVPGTLDTAAISTAVTTVMSNNAALPAPSLGISPAVALYPGAADIVVGDWDFATSSMKALGPASSCEAAVQVNGTLGDDGNPKVPAMLAGIIGRSDDYEVNATATAYVGCPGTILDSANVIPVLVDCCKLRGPGCTAQYCPGAATNPPNACNLNNPQVGDGPVSCLFFEPTGQQWACWTDFEQDGPATGASDIRRIIRDGPQEIVLPYETYATNGTVASALMELRREFLRRGDDIYPPSGGPDSWVVGLPIVECQDADHCATSNTDTIIGVACFEIREVDHPSQGLEIRGRFLCEGNAPQELLDQCPLQDAPPGGTCFSICSEIPVLVQ